MQTKISKEVLNNSSSIIDIKTIAEAALPKTGGEMTGAPIFKGHVNSHFIVPFVDKIHEYDEDEKYVGLVRNVYSPGADFAKQSIEARNYKEDGTQVDSVIAAYAFKDGTVCGTCPPPRGLYNNDISTFKSVVDYGLKKIPYNSIIHIDAINGSDTADLNNGRGLTADMPFKSLGAARTWVISHCGGSVINFQLHSDITIDTGTEIGCPNFAYAKIYSDSTKRTITITSSGYLGVGVGGVVLSNLIFNAQNSIRVLNCNAQYNAASIYFDTTMEFNGSVFGDVLDISRGGKIVIPGATKMPGNITGRKYKVITGGLLIGASVAPGTIDGTADASSIVA